ncbi:MAG TPA: glycosyltransferase family 4 protein [Actinomycetales bacterium]|nr:glycosyltransferase family 4 protein [Actinomycetales bacterium]
MTKVLLVGKGAPERGGIPSFIDIVLASSADLGHDVTFLNLAPPGPRQGGRASRTNVTRTVRDTVAVWRRSAGQDVVHIHTACAPGVTALRAGALATAGRLRGAHVVVHVHGGLVRNWLTGRPRRALMRAALAPADRVVVVSCAVLQALAPIVPHRRLSLMDNAVDEAATVREVRRAGPPRVLFVGNLTPRKGVLELLAASRALTRRGVEHELLIAGGTPDEGVEAEAQVRSAARDSSAQFLGALPRESMPAVYRQADVLCLPSWWEAMPLSILEAMAAGLPVIAADVGDVSRAVEDGVSGLLVPPRDPLALAGALEQLLGDPEAASRMGAAGRAIVAERFSTRRLQRDLASLYSQFEQQEKRERVRA